MGGKTAIDGKQARRSANNKVRFLNTHVSPHMNPHMPPYQPLVGVLMPALAHEGLEGVEVHLSVEDMGVNQPEGAKTDG